MFQFKQFAVRQEKAAMKVGTDGVLLGAWAPIGHQPFSILDIGAGTGLVALMLAQRTDAEQIDAIEIDAGAYEDCVENFEESPWNDRLFCYHASLDDFMEDLEDEEYDLIVSNPPFYTNAFPSGDTRRDAARMEHALPFGDLAEAASVLLSDEGLFCAIVPFSEEAAMVAHAAAHDLFLCKRTHVSGTPDSGIKRSLLAFSRQAPPEVAEDRLIIENARHDYTPGYIALTRDFYLKME
jgi:tRNA1Val (adenine37-N6)-methyltransferase